MSRITLTELEDRAPRIAMVTPLQPDPHDYARILLDELERTRPVYVIGEIDARNSKVGYRYVSQAWHRGHSFSFRIARTLSRLGIKVAHIQHEFNRFDGIRGVLEFPLLLLFLRFLKIRTIVSAHQIYPANTITSSWCDIFGLPKFPASWLVHRAAFSVFYFAVARLATVIHVNSHVAAGNLEKFGANQKKLVVIPIGVPPPLNTISQPDAPWQGLLTDAYVLAFGFVLPRKGLEVLIDSLEHIKAKAPGAQIVIAGASLPRHRDYADSLRKRIEEKFSASDILFVGEVSDSEMLWLFERAAVAVFPYITPAGSSAPLTFALRAGLPVVASDLPVLREVVQTYSFGILVQPNESSELGIAIGSILSDSTLSEGLREGSRKAAVAMSWHELVKQVMGVYDKCLS